MKPGKSILLLTLLSGLFSPTLYGQQCNGQVFGTPLSFNRPTFPWTDHFIALTRLGNHYMPLFGSGDAMTRPIGSQSYADHADGTDVPPFGSTGFHETYYIPRDNLTGTLQFWRLFNPNSGDHMDSADPFEANFLGYSFEFAHGAPWSSQRAGTSPLRRYFNTSNGDHWTSALSQPPAGYIADATYDASSGTPRFGFARFENCLGLPPSPAFIASNAYRYILSNKYIRIDFNTIWGNAIGKITHLPSGRQLVNEREIGALVQSALWLSTAMDPPLTCCAINPTEAGGTDDRWHGNTLRWAGSPVISVTSTGTSPRSLVTEVKPLNWRNDISRTAAGVSTDPYSPLLWRGTFRKTTTLGYQIGTTVYPEVIKIRFEAQRDSDAPSSTDQPYNMNNVFFFRGNPLTSLERIDLVTGAITSFPPEGSSVVSAARTGVIGIIDSSLAIGVMRINNPQRAYNIRYSYSAASGYDFILGIDPDASAFRALGRGLYTTDAREEAALVVGAPATVRKRLQQIHCHETGVCGP